MGINAYSKIYLLIIMLVVSKFGGRWQNKIIDFQTTIKDNKHNFVIKYWLYNIFAITSNAVTKRSMQFQNFGDYVTFDIINNVTKENYRNED